MSIGDDHVLIDLRFILPVKQIVDQSFKWNGPIIVSAIFDNEFVMPIST